jgi:hypothetical protein
MPQVVPRAMTKGALGYNVAGCGSKHERGFTLFEVAISTVLVTFGVVSVMMLLPSGLKAQQQARYQIHAAVVMQNMAMKLSNPGQQMFNVQVESEKLTNNLYLNRAAPSLESIAEGSNLQLAPLPVDIAKRLDSDNEEINRIVSEGGRIYYNLPGGPPQALIIGFVGYEQQNALPNHPCIAWPYWDHHPCAPSAWERTNWALNSTWPGQAEIVNLYAVLNSASMPTQASITAARWLAYKQAAQALVLAVASETNSGLVVQTTPYGPVLNPPTPFPTRSGGPLGPWIASSETERRNLYPKPYVVWAASHLAHAAALGTGTLQGRNVPTGPGPTADEITYARLTYESCRQWVMRAITADPYNWGVARQVAQQTAFDFPLMQHDLFPGGGYPAYTDPMSDPIVVPPDPPRQDTAWRVVGPRRANPDGSLIPRLADDYGQARGLYGSRPPPNTPVFLPPNKSNIDGGWGDPAHFHLTRRFDPSERMRQVVFWSVDWQAYEDFEELPSPLHDASMGFKDSYGTQVSADWWGISLPERGNYWTTAARTTKAGAVRGANGGNQTYDAFCDTVAYKEGFFMGIHGADRNGNGRYDRGTVPKSVRLRATQVARFTIYDRVLQGELRH